MDNNSLSRLLRSPSPQAQLLGWGVALFFFLPTVFRVADDPLLSPLQRAEQISLALGQMCAAIALAIVPPEKFSGSPSSPSDHAKSEDSD